MKKLFWVLLGCCLGIGFGFLMAKSENGSNNGNSYYGDVFAEAAKKHSRGMGSNNGNNFYNDAYVQAHYVDSQK